MAVSLAVNSGYSSQAVSRAKMQESQGFRMQTLKLQR